METVITPTISSTSHTTTTSATTNTAAAPLVMVPEPSGGGGTASNTAVDTDRSIIEPTEETNKVNNEELEGNEEGFVEEKEDDGKDTRIHPVPATTLPPPARPKPRGVDPPAPIAETGDSFRHSSETLQVDDDVDDQEEDTGLDCTSTGLSNDNVIILPSHSASHPVEDETTPPFEEVPIPPPGTQMKYVTSNGIESATSNRSNRTFSSVSSGGSEHHQNNPDLSNLWRKNATTNSNSYSGGPNGGGGGHGASHPNVVRYPTVFEHAVQLPPVDSILTTTSPTNNNNIMAGLAPAELTTSSSSNETNQALLLTSQPSSLSSSKEEMAPRATQPGAVAVMYPTTGKNSTTTNTATGVPPPSKSLESHAVPDYGHAMIKNVTLANPRNSTAHVSPVSFASLPTPSLSYHMSQGSSEIQEKVSLASDSSFWEKKLPSTITTVKSNDVLPKSIPRHASLQLDSLYETTATTSTQLLSENRQSHSMVMTTFDDEHAHKNTAGERKTERSLRFLQPTSSTTNQYRLDEPHDPPKASFGPMIWGKKTSKKSSLEDDMGPDSIEMAFAEGISTSSPPLPPPPPPMKGTSRTPSDDDKELQAALEASQIMTYDNNTGDFEFEAALLASKNESKEEDDTQPLEASTSAMNSSTAGKAVRLSEKAIEDAKENAHSARSMIASGNVDLDFLQTMLDLCRSEQRIVAQAIEDAMFHEEINADLGVLIDLNNNILDVLEAGDRMIGKTNRYDDQYSNVIPPPTKTNNLDVEELVEKRDIFSLICMLRVQMNEKRLDAVYALMKFSRAAEKNQDKESIMLRDEIRSSGGLHSLLTLFVVPDTLYELRAITALAVAYLVPALVESSSETPPSVGLRVVECLKYLSTVSPLSYRGELLGEDEMRNACTLALASLWVNHLESLISSNKIVVAEQSLTVQRGVPPQKERNLGGDQRREMITIGEFLDQTVSLIMYFAKLEAKEMKENQDFSFTRIYTVVEHVCATEVARPIAVREGVLQALICWIQSNDRDRTRSACSALRDITSVVDKYMAGWIHSEMVNKGAVQCLANLTQDFSLTREVRLSIAQILSSLCAAPHTRAAVVETNCINFLIGILYEHNDPSSSEVAVYAGRAILQLAAGAISRAPAFVGDDVEPFGSTPIDRRDSLIG